MLVEMTMFPIALLANQFLDCVETFLGSAEKGQAQWNRHVGLFYACMYRVCTGVNNRFTVLGVSALGTLSHQ